MKLLIPYPGLTKTIGYIVRQARESVDQVPDYVPDYINDPEALFHYLKSVITYRSDPPGKEYIQTVQTLFDKNNEQGDCDCCTVLSLASLYACSGIRANMVLGG